ncbi:MAG: transcriptional regulator [Verrucomicrobiota bacterium]|nr:transcriptional regulator [Verrucomicrobiota bacterium]
MINLDKLDKVIHEKGRLAIMSLLAARPTWSFQDLKTELNFSDGNLLSHLRTLQSSGYIASTKEMHDRPQTNYSLTPLGGETFEDYLGTIEELLKLNKH